MLELTIRDEVYQFLFGMGFMREVNKKVVRKGDADTNATKNIGLQFVVGGIIDKDVEILVDALMAANKGQNPRVTRDLLDAYIDDEDTDINELFETVMDFLLKTNATKSTATTMKEEVDKLMKAEAEKEKARQEVFNS